MFSDLLFSLQSEQKIFVIHTLMKIVYQEWPQQGLTNVEKDTATHVDRTRFLLNCGQYLLQVAGTHWVQRFKWTLGLTRVSIRGPHTLSLSSCDSLSCNGRCCMEALIIKGSTKSVDNRYTQRGTAQGLQ